MPAWVHRVLPQLGRTVSGFLGGGATISYLTYRWMANNEKQRAIRDLEWKYYTEVQDSLVYLGAQRNYLEVHGVRLEDFMRDFPRVREFPGQFAGGNGKDYLNLDLWLEVRKSCHRLNGYWDSYLEGWRKGVFPEDASRGGSKPWPSVPWGSKPLLTLSGRWANRARNFCEMVEPLERANFEYMKARGQYKKPSRFRVLEDAYAGQNAKTSNV